MNDTEIKENINKYRWYHTVKINQHNSTPGLNPIIDQLNGHIAESLKQNLVFKQKKVLDLGCRDGYFSFLAEELHAEEVLGIDNDLSRGATDFLIPYKQSKVRMQEMNLYDLEPDEQGPFDIILCLGVLYHLRFPFYGLKKIIDCLDEKGFLVISTVILNEPLLDDLDLLYCAEDSEDKAFSYPAVFNERGLLSALNNLNCRCLRSYPLSEGSLGSRLYFFQKNSNSPQKHFKELNMDEYYYATHDLHSHFNPEQEQKIQQLQSKRMTLDWQKLKNWKDLLRRKLR